MRRLFAVALLAAGVGTVLLLTQMEVLSRTQVTGVTYVRGYEHVTGPLDKALGLGDGQAFAAIARDPTFARPDVFRAGRAGAAYRFGRPLFGELVWLLSVGRSGAVPAAMAILCVASVGAAAAAIATIIAARRANPMLAVVVAVLPGAWAATVGLTPEVLALAFAAWGVVVCQRSGRPTAPAVLLCTAAVLTRETMVLVPLSLAAWRLSASRNREARREIRWLVVAPPAALGAWYTVVRLRVGAWPFTGSPGGTFGWPFGGLLHELTRWGHPLSDLVALLVGLALATVVVQRRRGASDALVFVVVAYLAFAPLMGPAVWRRWEDFGRPLLPLYAFALVVVAEAVQARRADREVQVMSSMR